MKIIHDLTKVCIKSIDDVYKHEKYFYTFIAILDDAYTNEINLDSVEKEIFLITINEIKTQIQNRCLSNRNFRLLMIVTSRFSLLDKGSIKPKSIQN